MKKLLGLFLLLVCVLTVPMATHAQNPDGTITGVVADPSGAVVPGAVVTVTSVERGTVRKETVGAKGTYRIESILPGTYNITVTAPNFEETKLDGLIVAGTVVTTGNVSLKPGRVTESVEVQADNSLLNTDNGQISGTISTEEISDLPLNGLNPYALALTLPGVTAVTQGAFSNGTTFAVGGGRPRANNFLIEGQDNNDAGIAGQGLQPGNPESVKEVDVVENSYTAEYGHGAGSVSNLIYKSGTNQFHGALFERLNNSSLDASDHYNTRYGQPKNKYRENLFGFTFGGPLVKNKLFFFGAYQWDKYRSTTIGSALTTPDAAGLATLQMYASDPRVANLIAAYGTLVGDPAFQSSGGQDKIELGPDPNNPTVDRGAVTLGSAVRHLGVDSDAPELDVKVDYVISQKDTLSSHVIRSGYSTPLDAGNFPGQLPGFDTDQSGVSYNAGIAETHTFTSNLVNDLRASYGRIGFTFGLAASTLANPLYDQPGVSISGLTGYGIPTNVPQGRFHNTYQLQDTVAWTKGKNFMKFGFDLADIRVRDQIPFNFYGTISYADSKVTSGYTGLANFIDNYGGSGGNISQNFGSPTARPTLFSQNYFAEDTYKPNASTSIDIGFRYEYNGAPFNAPGTPYPGIDYNDPACFPTEGVVCNTKQQADGSGWGPRLGLSFSPSPNARYKTVVRSGFGVFYDVVYTNIIDNIQASAPNAAAPSLNSLAKAGSAPRGTPDWSASFSNLNQSPLPTDTAEPISDHLLSPRTMHWNLNIEQELPGKFSAMVGYVGERGNHLYASTEYNPYLNQYASAERLFPTRGRIITRDNSGDSNYHGLWAELDRKFSKGLLFRASYTYGKAIDDSSEIFTFNNESTYGSTSNPSSKKDVDTGLSAYDHRQRLVLTYIYAPPIWHTEGAMKIAGNIVNRWQISGITSFQSGTPENVEVGTDVNGDGIGNDRPTVGNKKAPLDTYAFDDSWYYGVSDGGYCEGSELWDTNDACHVVTPDQVHWLVPGYGTTAHNTIGRNSLISPGFQNWDMGLQRSFKVWEKSTFDVRAELFNAFNHGNAGIENSTLTSGIPFTEGGFGDHTFADPIPTVSGYRHFRMYVRYVF